MLKLGCTSTHSITWEIVYINITYGHCVNLFSLKRRKNQNSFSVFRDYKMGTMARHSLTNFIIPR